ncbi:MAG: class I SAM-dependent methyltransferase [Parvibaculales bacterium]
MSRQVPQIFDRLALRRNRQRAAARLADYDFLLRRAAADIADRLMVQNRNFDRLLCLGASGGYLRNELQARGLLGSKIGQLIEADLTDAMLAQGGLVLDEECLPLKPACLDGLVAFWGLHHVNDLPGALLQMRQALKPDGVFLAALPGNENLRALSSAFIESQSALTGAVRPHMHPSADLRDLAGLLQRAGFALPVADSDLVEVRYGDPLRLLRDLRGMGESNILQARHKGAMRRDVLVDTLSRFSAANQQDGKTVAVFEICYLAGFAPAGTQTGPHEPGTLITRFDETPITGNAKPD